MRGEDMNGVEMRGPITDEDYQRLGENMMRGTSPGKVVINGNLTHTDSLLMTKSMSNG